MGRLTLNILLSFAQFEREIISERTRDKLAAARRKGKWSGGKPLLGYDILPGPAGSKLIVNEAEAHQVKRIFELYLEHQALIPTVTAITAQGWCNKRWTTKRGDAKGGRPFDKTGLYKLLTNRTYTGVVTYQGTIYPGEHPAIVENALFERVEAVLSRNGHGNGATVKNRYGALLRGLLHCSCCRCSMIHTYSVKKRSSKRYRYYVCLAAQKKGWHTCPSKSVPAGEIEAFVVDQIKKVGQDPVVLTKTLRSMQQQNERQVADLEAQQKAGQRALARHHAAIRKLMAAPDAGHLAVLNDQMQAAEETLRRIGQQIATLQADAMDPDQVRSALSSFTPVWEQLSPKEQERVVRLLVERVAYDGAAGTIAVTFRVSGIKALAGENTLEVAA